MRLWVHGVWFMIYGLWLRVEGLREMEQPSGFSAPDFGVAVQRLGYGAYGLWFMVCGSWFMVYG